MAGYDFLNTFLGGTRCMRPTPSGSIGQWDNVCMSHRSNAGTRRAPAQVSAFPPGTACILPGPARFEISQLRTPCTAATPAKAETFPVGKPRNRRAHPGPPRASGLCLALKARRRHTLVSCVRQDNRPHPPHFDHCGGGKRRRLPPAIVRMCAPGAHTIPCTRCPLRFRLGQCTHSFAARLR